MINQYTLLAIVAVCICGLILLLRRPGTLRLRVKAGKDRSAELDYKPIAQQPTDKPRG